MPRIYTTEQQSKAGKARGRQAVKTGQFASMLALPQTKAAQIENGKRNGKLAVESGQLDSARNLPQTKAAQSKAGKINGALAAKSGQLRVAAVLGGKKQGPFSGRKNVESGHLAKMRQDPKRLENLRPILLERNKPDGIATVASVKFWATHPERASHRSKLAMHQRWHVTGTFDQYDNWHPAKPNPAKCQFCKSKV